MELKTYPNLEASNSIYGRGSPAVCCAAKCCVGNVLCYFVVDVCWYVVWETLTRWFSARQPFIARVGNFARFIVGLLVLWENHFPCFRNFGAAFQRKVTFNICVWWFWLWCFCRWGIGFNKYFLSFSFVRPSNTIMLNCSSALARIFSICHRHPTAPLGCGRIIIRFRQHVALVEVWPIVQFRIRFVILSTLYKGFLFKSRVSLL